MIRQKRKDTEPERQVRSVLTTLGVRYRLAPRDLPGSPDIANKRGKWAVFVHGCYWHMHSGCSKATVPKRNRVWWIAKLRRNRIRDAAKLEALERLGYAVAVVWECETRDVDRLTRSLRSWLDDAR
jgi:DNA mismatch endonuclease (patch repair protein)